MQMIHKLWVCGNIPVDAVLIWVFHPLFSRLPEPREAARAVLEEEHKHVNEAASVLPFVSHGVVVPDLKPFLAVLVDCGKEEVVQEPYVLRQARVEAVVGFKLEKKNLPLLPEA